MNENDYSIHEMLLQNRAIYQIPDDRLYSVDDLLYNHQVFVNNFLKANSKKNKIENLSVSLAWYLAIVNRYHIDIEKELWIRYAYKCPYCLDIPCSCIKEGNKSQKTGRPPKARPKDIEKWQIMIKKIFPNDNGKELEIKLEKILEEINQLIRTYLREKKNKQFDRIKSLFSDYFVQIIRIFNHDKRSIKKEYGEMLKNGCYVCHKIPCECNYFK